MTIFQGVILNGTEVINAPTIVGNTAFQTNDQTITFGQPLAAASTRLSQDTTRAQLVLGLGTGLGSQLVIGANAWIGRDFDHAAPANPTLFIHSAVDPDVANTQWLSLAHDQTNAVITTGKGFLSLTGAGGAGGTVNIGSTAAIHGLAAANDLMVSGALGVVGKIYTDGGLYSYLGVFATDGGNFETSGMYLTGGSLNFIVSGAGLGNYNFVFTKNTLISRNFDHALSANPTLFMHSATDPDVNNTQWLSLTHDTFNGRLSTGSGGLLVAANHLSIFSGFSTSRLNLFDTNALADPMIGGGVNLSMKIGVGANSLQQLILTNSSNIDKNHDHAAPVNPTLFIHSVVDPDVDNTQWISTSHNQTNAVIATGAGDLILDPITEITEVCGVGLKTKEYNLTLNNGAKVNLPAGTGWGTFMIGDNQEYARIRWTAAAVVTLDEGTANVAIADTPAFFCLYDDVATVAIKNNLGVNLTLRYVIHYS
jgi:hypothetical protein